MFILRCVYNKTTKRTNQNLIQLSIQIKPIYFKWKKTFRIIFRELMHHGANMYFFFLLWKTGLGCDEWKNYIFSSLILVTDILKTRISAFRLQLRMVILRFVRYFRWFSTAEVILDKKNKNILTKILLIILYRHKK